MKELGQDGRDQTRGHTDLKQEMPYISVSQTVGRDPPGVSDYSEGGRGDLDY
jgi:hypothetical protein